MAKWKTMNWPNNLFCVDAATYIISTQPQSRKLNRNDFQGVSALWSVGIISALIAFASENLYHFIKHRKNILRGA